jgi:hypothetical protein
MTEYSLGPKRDRYATASRMISLRKNNIFSEINITGQRKA